MERIESIYDLLDLDLEKVDVVKLKDKLNEIIDRLNEQPEEEYRYFNGDEPIKDKETMKFIEGLPDSVWEDTPEEWEKKDNLYKDWSIRELEGDLKDAINSLTKEDLLIYLTDTMVFAEEHIQELNKAREEERDRMAKAIENMKYKGDIEKFKHIKTTFDCKTVEEYIWFIESMTLSRVLSKLNNK